MAAAASRVTGQKTVAFMGDSTFFHSGMPPLLNAAEAGDDVVVVVLDNRVTGMTGHQPSASTPRPEDGNGAVFYPLSVAPGGQQVPAGDNDVSLFTCAFHVALSLPGAAA